MKESAVRVPSDLSGKVGSPTTLEETVRPLIELSIKGLERMWMKDQGLFCFTVRDGQNGPAPEGVSLRYTAITLLGLHRAATNGWPVPLDLKSILRQTIEAAPTTRNIGTLALILWAGAALTQKVDPKVEAAIRSHGPFYQEAGNGVYATTELAWLLIAMIEAAEITTGAERHRFEETAHLAYRLLKRNFNSRSALFAFSTQISSNWTRPLRSRLGFFDGQVYGIYSFAQYARHFSDGEALSHAKHCAERICDFQGGGGSGHGTTMPCGEKWSTVIRSTPSISMGWRRSPSKGSPKSRPAITALRSPGGFGISSARIPSGFNLSMRRIR
ncbi:MAG: hypothetical protein MPW13_04515 [Candidatus Manganitrophus sp.]|nr:hypothetical protein [Candidatus Manganitrophus sp.]